MLESFPERDEGCAALKVVPCLLIVVFRFRVCNCRFGAVGVLQI